MPPMLENNVHGLVTGVSDAVYQSVLIADSPYSYYPFNETTGTTANDISGNARNGTFVNATLASKPVRPGTSSLAPYFNGSNTYVDITASNPFINSANWSVEAWLNLIDYNGPTNGSSNGMTLISNATTNTKGVSITSWSGKFDCWCYTDNFFGPTTGLPAVNKSYHFAVTCSASKVMAMYVNGVLIASKTFGSVGWGTGVGALYAGIRNWTGGYTHGYMSDLAIYTKTLSSSDIARHYSGTPLS